MTHNLPKRKIRITVLGAASSPHVLARAKIFQTFGHDVTLISPVAASRNNDFRTVGTFKGSGLWGKVISLLTCMRYILCIRGDLVHAHYAAEYGTWVAAFFKRKPLVITVMGGDILFEEQGNLGGIARFLTKWSLRRADLVTAKSESLAKHLQKIGVQKDRIKLVYWGVEKDIFFNSKECRQNFRQKNSISEDQVTVYCPRMLQPLYNQDVLISAFAQLCQKYPNLLLLLSKLGEDKQYSAELERQISEYDLHEKIRFLAAVPRQEMADLYNGADVMVAIPDSDGMPQSTLEAMACKLPVIMSDLDKYQELFSHNENCLMTAINDSAVADAMERLCQNKELAQQLSEKAYQVVMEKADFYSEAQRVEYMFFKLLGHVG